MNIRKKALIISIAPAIAIVGLLLTLLLSDYRASLRTDSIDRARLQLENLAHFIDGRNLHAVTTAKTLASTQQAGLMGNHPLSMAIARQTLANHSEFQGAYFGYDQGIAPVSSTAGLDENCCKDGRFLPYFYRDSNGISLAPLLDMETGLYYEGLRKRWQQATPGREHWLITEPYIYEGTALVEQVYPILIDGKFVGIAGVDRKLDKLLTLIDDFRPYNTSKTWLISRLGKFITATHDTKRVSMKSVTEFPALSRLFKAPGSNQQTRVTEGEDPATGNAVYVIYTSIPTGEWGLVTTVEKDELMAPVTNSTYTAISTAVVLLLLLSGIVYVLVTRMVSQPLADILEKLQRVAEGCGNLKTRVEINSNDEVGELATAFNRFIGTQADMIGQLDQAVSRMDSSTQTMKDTIDSTKGAVSSQRNEHLQVSAAVSEMSATAREVAKNVSLVASNISDVTTDIEHGQSSVAETVTGVDHLEQELNQLSSTIDDVSRAAHEIGSVLEVINGIAEQTNLLALNAAIEAARAGEQGRGFAVVADEVRTLAQRTQSSTLEIHQVIETLQRTAELAVNSMVTNRKSLEHLIGTANVAGDSLGKITDAMTAIEDISNQISVAAEQQSATTDEIDRNIHRIVESAEHCGTLATQAADSVNDMDQTAKEVAQLVNQFEY